MTRLFPLGFLNRSLDVRQGFRVKNLLNDLIGGELVGLLF